MDPEELNKLHAAITDAGKDLKQAIEERDEQIKELGRVNDDLDAKVNALGEKLVALESEATEIRKQMIEFQQHYSVPDTDEWKTLGEEFIESDAYKRMRDAGSYESSLMPVKDIYQYAVKQLVTSDPASAGTLIDPQRYPVIIAPPDQPLRIRDLLPVQPTTSNSIEYVEETGFTSGAAMVDEPPGGTMESETEKPMSEIEFDVKSAPVRTVAHWIPATRQVIDDASQLRAYMDTRMIYGLKLEEESQLLYGDGEGINLQGIMTHDDVQTYSVADNAANVYKMDTLRRAMTRVAVAGYPATGVVLNDFDWEDIELAKGNDDHYIWISVTEGGQMRFFRVPVVVTQAIEQGTALTGAFSLAAMIWDRQQAGVRLSEHHKNFFTKNLVAILAEERLALTIFRPEAFVVATLEVEG